jgi:hypothetical protein
MGRNRVGSPRPCHDRCTFADGCGGLIERVFLELFDAFMRNPREMPAPGAEDVDSLCLQRAGEGVLFSLYSEIGVFADHYGVPVDVLWGLVADWVVSDHMGSERTPAEFLIPGKDEPK